MLKSQSNELWHREFSSSNPVPHVEAPSVAWWKRWMRVLRGAAETMIAASLYDDESRVSALFGGGHRLALFAVPLLILTVGYLDYVTGDVADAGIFYHLPIILTCALLGTRGLLIVPICFALFHANELITVPATRPHSIGNDLSHIGSFGIMAALTFFARSLYLTLVASSRELVLKQYLDDREMALAEQVQHCLFNIPASGYEDADLIIRAHSTSLSRVGGDFCHVVTQADEVGLFVGDVVGKGVPAALVMAMCITALTEEHRRSSSPALALQRCNEVLFESFTGENFMTATACVARFDRRRSELILSLAGHEPPIMLSETALVPRWKPGILMGVVSQPEYALHHIAMRPGQKLLLFTDGATEARDPEGELFGRDRLQAALRRWAHLPAEETLERLLEEIQAFVRTAGLCDDLTLVLLERRGATGSTIEIETGDRRIAW